MISRYFASIDGIAVFGVISLCVSILAFIAITVRALRTDPPTIARLERLPLEPPDSTNDDTTKVNS
jgi:hypothetical protein